MGTIKDLHGRSIYLDTNIIIYFLEGAEQWRELLSALFLDIQKGSITAITSQLTLAELLVKPLELGNELAVKACRDILAEGSGLIAKPIDAKVLDLAAQLRAHRRIKLPDAIHAATAAVAECDFLLTNDRRFATIDHPQVLLLSELSAL